MWSVGVIVANLYWYWKCTVLCTQCYSRTLFILKKVPWNCECLKWNANAPGKQKVLIWNFSTGEYEVIFTFSVFLITGSPSFHGGNRKLWQTPPSRWQNFTLSQILQGKINESFKTISWKPKRFFFFKNRAVVQWNSQENHHFAT